MRTKRINSTKVISVLLALCLAGLDFSLRPAASALSDIIIDLLLAQTLILLRPCPHEKLKIPVPEIIIFALIVAFSAVSSVFSMPCRYCIIPVLDSALLIVDATWRFSRKFNKIATLFRCVEVWNNVEDYTRLTQVSITLFLTVFYLSVRQVESALAAAAVLLPVLLFYIQLLISDTSASLIGRRKKDNLINVLEGVGLKKGGTAKESKEAKMMDLYDRTLKYVMDKKPYLEDDMKLEALAKVLYTNKSRLSKAINTISGRNYNQFFNYFRVEEAIQYMQDHPDASLAQVAFESGFHNTVSMNSAFVLYKHMTPGEYMERLREQK